MKLVRPFAVLWVLATSGAVAQTNARGLAPANASAITVTGRATVAVEPDRARVSVTIAGGGIAAGAPSVPVDEAANVLRDALGRNGVADPHVVFPVVNLNARNIVPVVVGTVAKPTRDRLEEIARAVIQAIPDRYAAAFANAQVQTTLAVDECGPAEARAERAAFADAKARAARLASDAGVRLGNVIALTDVPTFPVAACRTSPDGVEGGPLLGNPFANQYGPLVVPITVDETVQFAIAP